MASFQISQDACKVKTKGQHIFTENKGKLEYKREPSAGKVLLVSLLSTSLLQWCMM